MSSEQYWRNQLAQTEAEYEQIIQGLRDEVEKQRKRCGELMHEQAMQRATAAADVRDFCQQYIAEAKQNQQQHQPSNTSTATAASSLQQQQSRSLSATHAAGSPLMPTHHLRFQNNNSSAVESVPLPALLTFLHEYSHGLLPLPENRRKRERLDASLSPLHHRLRQRMLARHRMTGREDYVLMEDGDAMAQQQQQQLENAASSPMSPPMGPSTGAPVSGPRFNNAVQRSAATGNGQKSSLNPPVVPASAFDARSPYGAGRISGLASAEDSERLSGSGGGGGGGPVMAASAFGLPTLPPR